MCLVYKVTNKIALDYMLGYFEEARHTHTDDT